MEILIPSVAAFQSVAFVSFFNQASWAFGGCLDKTSNLTPSFWTSDGYSCYFLFFLKMLKISQDETNDKKKSRESVRDIWLLFSVQLTAHSLPKRTREREEERGEREARKENKAS